MTSPANSTRFSISLFALLLVLVHPTMTLSADTLAKAPPKTQPSIDSIDTLDEFLRQSEQDIPDLVAGTEKTIIWASPDKKTTPYSVIYLHGYSASRQETAPLSDTVARGLGANLFYTRLRGHGRDGAAMLDGTRAAWFEDVEQAYRIGATLGEKVIVISMSNGAALTTWLAAQPFGERLASVVLISPNFSPASKLVYALDWPLGIGSTLNSWLGDSERSWEPINELQGRYWTHRYPNRALTEMVRLVKQVEAIDKSAISVPTLIIYSPQDIVIDTEAVERVFAEWGSPRKQLVRYEGSNNPYQHVIAGDVLSPASTPELARIILDFISQTD